MTKYCLNIVSDVKTNDALNKPKNDITKILSDQGFKVINEVLLKNKKERLLLTFNKIFKLNNILKKRDILVISYPTGMGHIYDQLLLRILSQKKVKTIAIIHDIDSLRFNVSKKRNLDYEIRLLNRYSYVISPNQTMSNKLNENGLTVKSINLEVFDYLTDINVDKKKIKFSKNVYYTGNLNKSNFIYDLKNTNTNFLLYGPIDNNKINSINSLYKGNIDSNELLTIMDNGFGLIWDGNHSKYIDETKISTGSYLKYNNPYKLSSYITAGIPVFIWKKAAEAGFVENENIGYTISSISEIDDILGNISEDEYLKICKNVRRIQQDLIRGYFTRKAIKNALEGI